MAIFTLPATNLFSIEGKIPSIVKNGYIINNNHQFVRMNNFTKKRICTHFDLNSEYFPSSNKFCILYLIQEYAC